MLRTAQESELSRQFERVRWRQCHEFLWPQDSLAVRFFGNVGQRQIRLNMSNPVLVEVIRGALVESRHRVAVAVFDADGAPVLAIGDIAMPVFPRSAVKALQALPLVEEGGADRYGFGDEELALACASHSGEPAHVAGVERMLAAAGL